MLKHVLILLSALTISPVLAGSLSDDIEELIALTKIEEDIKNQHMECISGSANITEAEIRHMINGEYSDIQMDSEDVALLISIYSEFYNYSCAYLAGDEVPNFYRIQFRKRFTHPEIESLIEFYKTPVGIKLNNQWIEINKTYGEILKERNAVDSFEAQRKFEKRMEDFWIYLEKKAAEETTEQGA